MLRALGLYYLLNRFPLLRKAMLVWVLGWALLFVLLLVAGLVRLWV